MDSTTQIYFEITLEEDGRVLGEAAAGGYESRIDIEGFQFHASAHKQALQDVREGVVSNLEYHRLSMSKVFDRSSLQLAGVLKGQKKFKEVKISVDQQYIDPKWTGKARNEILIMYLYDGYIADIKLRTSEGNVGASIKEDITMSFENCTIYYYAEDRGDVGRLGDDYRWEPCIFETRRKPQNA
jgi:type VI protein secretion system component Hcp